MQTKRCTPKVFSSGFIVAVYTKASSICWTEEGALCFASCVYCEPWLVWIQECEELIRHTERLNSLKSKRPRSLNTLRPCAAEVSYLFFLSCWARLHTARTRGSHAFQQRCTMARRRRRERADCREGRHDTPSQCPFHTSTAFFLLLLPLRLLLETELNIPGLRPGICVMPFDPLPPRWAHMNSKCSCLD